MKRFFRVMLIVLAVMMLNVCCEKDHITIIESTDRVGSDDDDIHNTHFVTEVKVVFSMNGDATVSGTNEDFSVIVNGNDVSIYYSGSEAVMYTLSGTTKDGFFKLYSTYKQGITLDNVSITNKNGAAINIQGTPTDPNRGQLTYVVLNGNNTLADGPSYTDTPLLEDEKAVLFCEGALVFSGEGSLAVTSVGKSGISSDNYLHLMSAPAIKVTSISGHGIFAKAYMLIDGGSMDVYVTANTKKGLNTDGFIWINGGTLNVRVTGSAAYDGEGSGYSGTAGIKADRFFRIDDGVVNVTNSGAGGKGISCDGMGYFFGGTVTVTTTGGNYTTGDVTAKAIKFDGNLLFAGSNVTARCSAHEGISTKKSLTIAGGTVYSYSGKDDAINAVENFTISGGFVCGHAADADGLDANGNFYIKGGVVYAIGGKWPEKAIDAESESGKKLYLEGGTIIAVGELENEGSLAQSCFYTCSWSKNSWYALTIGPNTYAFKTPSSGGDNLVVSGYTKPMLQSGVTVSGGTPIFNGTLFLDATVSGGSSVKLCSYS